MPAQRREAQVFARGGSNGVWGVAVVEKEERHATTFHGYTASAVVGTRAAPPGRVAKSVILVYRRRAARPGVGQVAVRRRGRWWGAACLPGVRCRVGA